MTLLATMPLRTRADAGAAFGTPDAVTWHIFVVQPKMEAELAAEEPGDQSAAAEDQTS